MSTHVPGPWQVHTPAPQRTFVVRRDERDAVFIVAELWNNGQDEQMVIANARVMAVAPEMLEALHDIAALEGRADGTVGLVDHSHVKALRVAATRARAVIAQAEGSPPLGRTQ